MTRLEAGALTPRRDPVDIAELVETTLNETKSLLLQHRIRADLPATLPMLLADTTLLRQIFFNLIDNAAKYAPPGGEIVVSVSAAASGLTIAVRDEGPGIAPADLEQVFNRFYRVGGADRRRAGIGLGLAICRGFAEAMGGGITAANRTDRSGAVFTLSFPAALMVPM